MDKLTRIIGRITLALLTVILLSGQADQLINGMDSSDNVRRILVDSSGRLVTSTTSGGSGSHGACTVSTFNIGTTGAACPTTARSDRASILIQLIQSGESMTITNDGLTVATATAGVQIQSGGTFDDDLLGTVATNCRCTAATCSVRTLECP